MYWLIRRRARVQITGQPSKRNSENISLGTSSQQIFGKYSGDK